MKKAIYAAAGLLLSALISGCDLREPERLDASTPPVQPTTPTAPDPVREIALEAGLGWVKGRVLGTGAPVLPVDPQQEQRLMLHPGEDDDAWLEVNVSGTRQLVLDPVMRDLSASPDCANNPDAGVVDLRWSLDGGTENVVRVDRKYRDRITVPTEGASRLRISAGKGNEVIWCDWLLVGFSDIEAVGQ